MTTPLITRLEEAAETSQAMTDTVRVPREPTPKMVRAGCAVTCVECFADCKSSDAAAIYRAMLAASPQEEGPFEDDITEDSKTAMTNAAGKAAAAILDLIQKDDHDQRYPHPRPTPA